MGANVGLRKGNNKRNIATTQVRIFRGIIGAHREETADERGDEGSRSQCDVELGIMERRTRPTLCK